MGPVVFLALLFAQAFPQPDISIHSSEHRDQGQAQVGEVIPIALRASCLAAVLRGELGALSGASW